MLARVAVVVTVYGVGRSKLMTNWPDSRKHPAEPIAASRIAGRRMRSFFMVGVPFKAC